MDLRVLSSEELDRRLKELVKAERENLIDIIGHLSELDRRGSAEELGFPSLYAYCIQELKYQEGPAYRRIRAARAVRFHPSILSYMRSGDLSLYAVVIVAPYLKQHGDELLERAKGLNTREVEAVVARIDPTRPPKDSVRLIGAVAPPPTPEAPALPLSAQAPSSTAASDALTSPGGPDPAAFSPASQTSGSASSAPADVPLRVRFSFTADSELWALVRRARELLRHKYPGGRLEHLFKDALRALLDRKDPDRRLLAKPPAPPPVPGEGPRERRVPQGVRDAVWRRDGGACAYVAERGRRCGSRDGLEYDHIKPWALGGSSDDAANIRLLCRAHNRVMAERRGLRPTG